MIYIQYPGYSHCKILWALIWQSCHVHCLFRGNEPAPAMPLNATGWRYQSVQSFLLLFLQQKNLNAALTLTLIHTEDQQWQHWKWLCMLTHVTISITPKNLPKQRKNIGAYHTYMWTHSKWEMSNFYLPLFLFTFILIPYFFFVFCMPCFSFQIVYVFLLLCRETRYFEYGGEGASRLCLHWTILFRVSDLRQWLEISWTNSSNSLFALVLLKSDTLNIVIQKGNCCFSLCSPAQHYWVTSQKLVNYGINVNVNKYNDK